MQSENIPFRGLDSVIEKVKEGEDSLNLEKLKQLIDEIPSALTKFDLLIEKLRGDRPEHMFHVYSRQKQGELTFFEFQKLSESFVNLSTPEAMKVFCKFGPDTH